MGSAAKEYSTFNSTVNIGQASEDRGGAAKHKALGEVIVRSQNAMRGAAQIMLSMLTPGSRTKRAAVSRV